MTRAIPLLSFFSTVVFYTTLSVAPVLPATQSTSAELFLQATAQCQQAEIALGELAVQRAADPEVKKFGAKMIKDHEKASGEIRQLASKEGIQLPKRMNERQRQKQQELSKLAGRAFDLAYIQYMLRDHKTEVKQFEQSAQQLQAPEIKHWASGTLPILKEHLDQAYIAAMSLGPRNLFNEEPVDVQ